MIEVIKRLYQTKRAAVIEVLRFATIGTIAAMVNLLGLALIVELLHWNPIASNVLAFFIAFQVSYFGHRCWTFADDRNNPHASAYIKFLIVAATGFVLNEGLFVVFYHYLHVYYLLASFLVLITIPPLTYFCARFWAFNFNNQ